MIDSLENFLGANFHQDIESVESAIDEIIEEESKEYLMYVIEVIEKFLDSKMSDNDKINIIIDNTDIYFKEKSQSIKWLINILDIIKNKVKN